ncbi:MAG: 2Fe-2S iron-sulfur cluster-binding protein [Oxalobacteraceae bacterium]|nr:2Fe-2S iron-sulfur cluster-binding protein [Oxalobacteraceae bacterium]
MPVVTIKPSGKTIDVASGTTLLEAVMNAGEVIAHKCEGKAECGSCHISMLEGRKSVSRIAAAENSQLDRLIGIGSKSRLACQTKVGDEDVTIELVVG